jgi:sodium/hydrogen exchanger-like protein 6/7
MIMLLITALFTSYLLQQKKIEAVHETVVSIFAGRTSYVHILGDYADKRQA